MAHHTTDRLHDIDSAVDYLRCGRRLIDRLVAEARSDTPRLDDQPRWVAMAMRVPLSRKGHLARGRGQSPPTVRT
jgi:hypothetical protein